jgi:hypothetical protein
VSKINHNKLGRTQLKSLEMCLWEMFAADYIKQRNVEVKENITQIKCGCKNNMRTWMTKPINSLGTFWETWKEQINHGGCETFGDK